MNIVASLILVLAAATTQVKDNSGTRRADRSKHERAIEIYTNDAAEYTIYRDARRKECVVLRREPVFVWSDPARQASDGAVFVWAYRGRAEAIGTIFSFPTTASRKVFHEFHSPSLSVLDVSRSGTHASTLGAPGPGHLACRSLRRASSRRILGATAFPDARACPRFFGLDGESCGEARGATPVIPAPVSL
jgi:hypothetical protein